MSARRYERLVRTCSTINQLNRVHIALENWLTPLQWDAMTKTMASTNPLQQPDGNPATAWQARLAQEKRDWVEHVGGMFRRSGNHRPQAFVRSRLARHVTLFSSGNGTAAAKTLAVCFTGMARRMMTPLPVFLQHIDADLTDVVLIVYPPGKGFRAGLDGVADSFESMLSALTQLTSSRPYRRKVAIGVSGGGLPAVAMAVDQGLDAGLAFGAGNPFDQRWVDEMAGGFERLLRRWQQRTEPIPPLHLIYGVDSAQDHQAAQVLAKFLPVKLIGIKTAHAPVGHVCLHPLIMAGQLTAFLQRTVLCPDQAAPRAPVLAKRALQQESAPVVALPAIAGPRYFAIGLNKTGTTSLGRCFEALALTPIAEPRSRHVNYLKLLHEIVQNGNYEAVLKVAEHFRAFQDRPWNVWDIYQRLDERFPESFFILTVRAPETWWSSVERWLTVSHSVDVAKHRRYLDHFKVQRLEKRAMIDAYVRYNDGVREYFAGRGNLLVMDLERGDGWPELCGFLQLGIPKVPFPHANKQRAAARS